MPNDFVDTFNSIIPSHIMKFILWHDDEESDVDVQQEDEDQYSEEDEDEEEVADVHSEVMPSQVLQV